MKITLNNKEIPVEIMDTPNSVASGMMGRDNLEGGMLFIFEDISERSFWMKNCLIPLDIIFIAGDKVTDVHENCPPCVSDPCEHYWGIGDKVLELPGGDYKSLYF